MMALQLPRILFAIGAADSLPGELTALAVRRPLLVTDQGLVACGVAGRIRALLPNAAVFDTTPENPVYAGSDAALAAYRAAGCDGVVALGGGSVIDTAKFVAVLACQGGTTAGLAEHTQPITDDVAPLIVLPTTAGTGSETSPDAGIHPAPNTRSRGISTPALIPRVAICDPGLTVTLPPRLTAGTGLDALSHCIEGYLSITDCAPAKAMALDGMRRAWRAVAHATARGEDLTAREEMMLAALAGGVAIGLGLGPAHAIAITCGDQGAPSRCVERAGPRCEPRCAGPACSGAHGGNPCGARPAARRLGGGSAARTHGRTGSAQQPAQPWLPALRHGGARTGCRRQPFQPHQPLAPGCRRFRTDDCAHCLIRLDASGARRHGSHA